MDLPTRPCSRQWLSPPKPRFEPCTSSDCVASPQVSRLLARGPIASRWLQDMTVATCSAENTPNGASSWVALRLKAFGAPCVPMRKGKKQILVIKTRDATREWRDML